VQPVPKAVYRSGCCDKHNRPRCDSNLGPLTPQSDEPTTRPLRPNDVVLLCRCLYVSISISITRKYGEKKYQIFCSYSGVWWLGSRVVSVLDSGAERPGFKSPLRRCRVTVLGKLFTPTVPLFTEQQNW